MRVFLIATAFTMILSSHAFAETEMNSGDGTQRMAPISPTTVPEVESEQPANPVPACAAPTASDLHKQYQYLLDLSERNIEESHVRNLKLLQRGEDIMTRQETDIAHYEKILETWEKQQAQYQKYLNSLKTKSPTAP